MKELNDFLSAFASANAQEYVSNHYEFKQISTNKREDIVAAFLPTLNLRAKDRVKIFLNPLTHWKEQIFTQFKDAESYWVGKKPDTFDIGELTPKKYLLDSLSRFFEGEEPEVYLLTVDGNFYYACSVEEYVFVSRKGIFLLSFQVHD